jgi:hypothetical protein
MSGLQNCKLFHNLHLDSGLPASHRFISQLTEHGTRAIYITHNNQPIEHNNQKDKRKHSGGHGVGFMIINA